MSALVAIKSLVATILFEWARTWAHEEPQLPCLRELLLFFFAFFYLSKLEIPSLVLDGEC